MEYHVKREGGVVMGRWGRASLKQQHLSSALKVGTKTILSAQGRASQEMGRLMETQGKLGMGEGEKDQLD